MASTKTIGDLLNHPRANVTWVCRAVTSASGTPYIVRLARIVAVPPKDGMGRLYVGVMDWGVDGLADCHKHIGVASGCGYDKVTAALSGARVGGVELGDHCDHKGRPTLRALADANGWELLGNGLIGW